MEIEKRAEGILADLLGKRAISVEELHRFTGASIGACAGALVLARECRSRENREWISGCFDAHLQDLNQGPRAKTTSRHLVKLEIASAP